MDSYRVISDVSGVPEMADLHAVEVQQPLRSGDTFWIKFTANYASNPVPYEPAVGARCQVIRSRNGEELECGGVVRRVTPFLCVLLDGEGFHSRAQEHRDPARPL
jgi:hypothetical protein